MILRKFAIAAAAATLVTLAGCASYGPTPPGWGEGWGRHVRRCLRHYPNYNPRTDLVERPNGVAFRCPL